MVPKSVLEAIKLGLWDFEPPEVEFSKILGLRCDARNGGEAPGACGAGPSRSAFVALVRSARHGNPAVGGKTAVVAARGGGLFSSRRSRPWSGTLCLTRPLRQARGA